MYGFVIDDLVKQFSLSENQLNELNEEIKNLSEKLKIEIENKNKISNLKEENKTLEDIQKISQEDINKFNSQIKELETNEKLNNEKINELRKENEQLKKEKENKIKNEENNKNIINNIKDLSKSLGLNLINIHLNENDDNKQETEDEENIEIKDIEEIQKNKTDYELKFIELKEKCNHYNEDIEQIKLIKENYKQSLNEINQQMNIFNERLDVSRINENLNNYNEEKNKILNEIDNKIEKISVSFLELDKIIFDIREVFGDNIENLLNKIQNNLINIDNKQYKSEDELKKIIKNIGNEISEIQSMGYIFEEHKTNFFDKNKNVEKEMKDLYEKVDLLNKLKKDNENNNNNIINNIIEDENINDNNNNENNNERNILQESFLFGAKDQSWKYKTHIVFNEDDDYIENFIDQPTLLRKNWHEICYVYDDYDIHDIYYNVKAVGLRRGSYFPTGSHSFYYNTIVDIESLLINGVKTNYKHRGYSIQFNLNLYNLQTATIYIRYKESKDLNKYTIEEIEERKIYRNEYYGLEKSLAGQNAKFSLILKGSFDIVNFKDYFLIKNKNNLNEKEYFWGGRVPYGGKRTLITLSKDKANWSFYSNFHFHSNRNIRRTSLYMPIEFVGGNNEIININASSPQTSNIILDEERRQYIINYKNINDNKGEFILKGELQNKCKGEWNVDLTDAEIERMIPEEDKLCKDQLKYIAKKIIEEFDKNNKNKDFEFLDYMKIALWVKKNIKYDLNYSGRHEMTAIDIYNKKVGVCHHFTKLSNALLYSLGYKVMYISGYASKHNNQFNRDSGHAWSLIKINDKWYPFDSTWGIVSGKLPVCHIFGFFFHKGYSARGSDGISFDENQIIGKFIS